MSALWIAAITVLVLLALIGIAAWFVWTRSDAAEKALVKRIVRLPFRAKLRLALALVRDSRIPLVVRGIPALLILYLASVAY